jgi:hypothetical protein
MQVELAFTSGDDRLKGGNIPAGREVAKKRLFGYTIN